MSCSWRLIMRRAFGNAAPCASPIPSTYSTMAATIHESLKLQALSLSALRTAATSAAREGGGAHGAVRQRNGLKPLDQEDPAAHVARGAGRDRDPRPRGGRPHHRVPRVFAPPLHNPKSSPLNSPRCY